MSEPNGEKVSQPIGKGHATAMLRLGLHELQGAMYTNSNVAQPGEIGVFGRPTQGELADDRRNSPEISDDKESASILNDTMNRAADRSSHRSGREREVDLER